LYADIDLRSGQVKSGGIGPQIRGAGKYKRQSPKSEEENPTTLARINQNTLLPFSESKTVMVRANSKRKNEGGANRATRGKHRCFIVLRVQP
jgi:hypothetical protein